MSEADRCLCDRIGRYYGDANKGTETNTITQANRAFESKACDGFNRFVIRRLQKFPTVNNNLDLSVDVTHTTNRTI